MTNARNIDTICPANTVVGTMVAYTDKKGRKCLAEVRNVLPGGVICAARHVPGVGTFPDVAVCTFGPIRFPWSDGRIRKASEMPGSLYLDE